MKHKLKQKRMQLKKMRTDSQTYLINKLKEDKIKSQLSRSELLKMKFEELYSQEKKKKMAILIKQQEKLLEKQISGRKKSFQILNKQKRVTTKEIRKKTS